MSLIPLTLNVTEFSELAGEILHLGHQLRFQAHGSSMHPFIQDGDILHISKLEEGEVKLGGILLIEKGHFKLIAHRLIKVWKGGHKNIYLIKGDALFQPDGSFTWDQVLGHVVSLERRGKSITLDSAIRRLFALIWIGYSQGVMRAYWKGRSFLRVVIRSSRAMLK